MKNFKEIEGDLIEMFKDGEFNAIAHGCNCFATMGAGIALTIGREFPEAKIADSKFKIPNGKKRLGNLSYTKIENINNNLVFNLYSQFMPGADFRLSALKKSLKLMSQTIKREFPELELSEIKIGFPLIGCGIGGGDWDEVKEVIKDTMGEFDVTVVHFTQLVYGVNYFPKIKKNAPANIGLFDDEDWDEDWDDFEFNGDMFDDY